MSSPKISVTDVIKDMRKHGMSMSPRTFFYGIESGAFPFAKIIGVSENTGRRTVLIMRKDYEEWAEEYLYV